MHQKYSELPGYDDNPFRGQDRIVKKLYGGDIKKSNTDQYSTVFILYYIILYCTYYSTCTCKLENIHTANKKIHLREKIIIQVKEKYKVKTINKKYKILYK